MAGGLVSRVVFGPMNSLIEKERTLDSVLFLYMLNPVLEPSSVINVNKLDFHEH